MSLFRFDWRKVYSKRTIWIFFLVCVALNAWLINRQENEGSYRYPPSAYRNLCAALEGKTNGEIQNILRERFQVLDERALSPELDGDESASAALLVYTDDLWEERELFGDCLDEITAIMDYAAFIDKIQVDAEDMRGASIFQKKNGFSQKNITKTAEDFLPFRDIQLKFGASKGVNMATGFPGTDVIAILLIFVICLSLFVEERERGLLALITTTAKGKGATAVSKIQVLLLSCLLILLLLYGPNFISAETVYGFGDVFRPIQSVRVGHGALLKLSVLGYFGLFCLSKYLVYLLIGLFLSSVCLLLKNITAIYLTIFGVFLSCIGLYLLVPSNSPFSFFRYINFYYFARTDWVLLKYLNINLLSTPVNIIPAFYFFVLIGIGVFGAMVVRLMQGSQLAGSRDSFFTRTMNRLRDFGGLRPKGVFHFELLKGIWHSKAALVFILFVAVQVYGVQTYSPYFLPDDIYYRNYMVYLEGEITQEKLNYLEQEQARFDEINARLTDEGTNLMAQAELQESLRAEKGFRRVMEQYGQITSAEEPEAEAPSFVYADGYHKLIGPESQMALISTLKLLIVLILCLSSFFVHEYQTGMNRILHTTAYGRGKTMFAKISVAWLLSLLVFILAYGADFLSVYQKIGLGGMSAPIQSLPDFAFCLLPCSILSYLVLMYCIRFFGLCIATTCILFISARCKTTYGAMTVSTGLFVVPAILSLMGVPFIDKIGFLPILNGKQLLDWFTIVNGEISLLFFYLTCGALCIVLFLRSIFRKFCL